MTATTPQLLVIDDDPDVLIAARLLLKKRFPSILTENDPYRLNTLLRQHHFDVVVLDMNFRAGASSGHEGIRWMKKILRQSPGTEVILMTAYGDIDLAVQAMREGAQDFVVKPWENDRLLESVDLAVAAGLKPVLPKTDEGKRLPTKGRPSHLSCGTMEKIVGQSPAMKNVFSTIRKVGLTDVNVIILGENGTGKELVARALHEVSCRKDEVFVNVDLGAIPETLFEPELFGHKKGAFTDAREDRAGRFEHAQNGTLFLDEIGNLSLPLQAKLLSALQSREVIRVGTNKPIPVNIRLICATNMPLYNMVRENSFRQDLLYRVNTVEIHLPPLRDRGGDVSLLAIYYLQLYADKYQKGKMELAVETLQKLQAYQWPGNIRELQHALERAVIMSDSAVLQPADFLLQEQEVHPAGEKVVANTLKLEDVERLAIRNAILKHNGNLSRAAKELGLGRTTLYRKMSKYGL
ncbi:MAG TPA: sigma-54-dependent Fis family transcriptional regulator [Bacteroidetes bacterium]|nr:sigma-54-dependent Fis family transcriptional regulator [Bacteroidota bacterium]